MHKWHFHRLIATHPLWHDMQPKHLLALEHCAHLIAYERGDWIGRVGESAEFFYLITGGCAELSLPINEADSVPIMRLNKQAMIGWSWLYVPFEWQYDVQAVTTLDAIAFNVECVRAMLEADHELGFQLMKRFGTVIQERQRQIRQAFATALQADQTASILEFA